MASERWPTTPYASSVAQSYAARGDTPRRRRHAQDGGGSRDPLALVIPCGTPTFDEGRLRGGSRPVRERRFRNCSRRTLPTSDADELSRRSTWRSCCSTPGERERAKALLDAQRSGFRARFRDWGCVGYGISDVQIHALRGDKAKALAGCARPRQAGWRGPLWRYYRDFDPNLASIRNEPEFKAVFADIERDMAQQRARLAARPKDAPLELTDASR